MHADMISLYSLDPIEEDEEGEGIVLQQQKLPWEGTDRDYKYEEVQFSIAQIIIFLYGIFMCQLQTRLHVSCYSDS